MTEVIEIVCFLGAFVVFDLAVFYKIKNVREIANEKSGNIRYNPYNLYNIAFVLGAFATFYSQQYVFVKDDRILAFFVLILCLIYIYGKYKVFFKEIAD